jgi:hypothetical protein
MTSRSERPAVVFADFQMHTHGPIYVCGIILGAAIATTVCYPLYSFWEQQKRLKASGLTKTLGTNAAAPTAVQNPFGSSLAIPSRCLRTYIYK